MRLIPSTLQRVRCLGTAIVSGMVVTALIACSAPQDHSAIASLPEGAWIHGDASRVRELLASLLELEGTPLARHAARLEEKLEGCGEFFGFSAESDFPSLVEAVACATSDDVPPALRDLRGDARLAFAFSIGESGRLYGALRDGAGETLVVDAHLDPSDTPGLARLLIPADEPAGPAALSARDTVIHARMRPASGLDIASLVPEGSQGDRMFRLRSELFLGHVLDGSWELAVYLPSEERLTPPMALALDFSMRPVAVAAMERFVRELEQTWPIHPQARRFGSLDGACIFDVKILPDLAPCYVIDDRSIIVGWNPASIEAARAGRGDGGVVQRGGVAVEASDAPARQARLGADGGVVVHLDRFREADRRLRAQLGQDATTAPSPGSAWERLQISSGASSGGAAVEIHVELAPRVAS